ncbi:MAG: ACP S-malonyltransferase [Pseudomonadota bacterium]
MQAYEQSGNETLACALLFPGQGTQHIGMGSEVCDQSPATARVWDCASDIAGFDVRRLCLKGPMPKLDKTQYQQVAVTTVNVATLLALRERQAVGAVAVAGHSVGEFSALYAAGVLGLEDMFRGVAARGRIMQALAEQTDGAMYAIKGIERDRLAALIATHELADKVSVANDNSPRQQVLSGCKQALKTLLPLLLRDGFEQVRLPVNGAWHSPLMHEGREDFQAVMDSLSFAEPSVPVFTNQAAAAVTAAEQIKRDLVTNLCATVRWRETMHSLADNQVQQVLEVGPKKVLGRLLLDFPALQGRLQARHAAEWLAPVTAQ